MSVTNPRVFCLGACLCVVVAVCSNPPAALAQDRPPATAPATQATVRAQCTDASGKPLPGVIATFMSADPFVPANVAAESGPDGRLVAMVPLGGRIMLTLVRGPAGLFPSQLEGDLVWLSNGGLLVNPRQNPQASFKVRLGPPTARLTGRVFDNQGKFVAGAKVFFRTSVASWMGGYQLADRIAAMGVRLPANTGERDPLTVTTDEGGNYSLGVPPGDYTPAGVRGADDSLLYLPDNPVVEQHAFAGGEAPQDVRLHLGGGLAITVTDTDGKPVAGARVRMGSTRSANLVLGMRARTTGTSSAAGLWQAWGLEPELMIPHVMPPENSEFAPVDAAPVRIEAGKTTTVTVKLPLGATVKGTVTDEAGKPLAGVAVGGVFTSGDGSYVLRGLPSGKATVRALSLTDPWLAPATFGDDLFVTGQEFKKDLTLRRLKPTVVLGKITGPDGNGIGKAQVTLRQYATHPTHLSVRVLTEPDGAYRLEDVVPLSGYLSVEPPADAAVQARADSLFVKEQPENRVDLQLQPAVLVTLSVRDADGKPVPFASLAASNCQVSSHMRSARGLNIPTCDQNGEISLRVPFEQKAGQDVKRILELASTSGDPLPEPAQIELPANPKTPVHQVVTLKSGPTLRGAAVDEAGKPVPGVEVLLGPQDTNIPLMAATAKYRVWVDADGRFVLPNVAPGTYRAMAQLHREDPRMLAPWQSQAITLKNSDTVELKIVMPAAGAIEGPVMGPDGQQLAADVEPMPADPAGGLVVGAVTHHSVPADDRPYTIRHLRPGKYRLSITLTDKADAARFPKIKAPATVEVKANETLRLDIHANP